MPTLGEAINSIVPGSKSAYVVAQVRVVGGNRLRLQGAHNGKTWETESPLKVTQSLAEWLGARDHEGSSIAGTGAKYVFCAIRWDGQGTRFQVAGPEFNRPWGAEFVIPGMAFPGVAVIEPPAETVTEPDATPDDDNNGDDDAST